MQKAPQRSDQTPTASDKPPKTRRDKRGRVLVRLGSLELERRDLEALDALQAMSGATTRVQAVRIAVRIGGLLGRLRHRGVINFGYLDERGEFVPLPALFW